MRNINSTLLGSPSSSQDGDKPAIPKTAIFIAHRLRTISDADIIFVLKDGEVAEQGTHEELLRKGGVYARMWAQQASAESAFEEGEEAVTA